MAWPVQWNRLPGDTTLPVRSLSKHGEAYIAIGSTTPNVDADQQSPLIYLTANNNTIAIDPDATAIAAGTPAFTMDVRRLVGSSSAITSQLVAQLSATTPAAYNCPPGEYVMICTVAADAAGWVSIQGRTD